MSKTKVLFVSQEILPFSAESATATSSRFIPQSTHERGKETRIFMPRYGKINERRHQLHEVIRLSGMNLIINDSDHPLIIKVASIPQIRLQVYFIDNEEYFHRKAFFTDDSGNFFKDNDERLIFFTKGVLETVKKLGWAPDIIHCHGWFGALMPLYVKKLYRRDPYFAESKLVVSLYNDKFQGKLDSKIADKIAFDGIPKKSMSHLESPDYIGLMKNALEHSDACIFAEEGTAPELKKYCNQLGIPTLNQFEQDDYLQAIDEFFDSEVMGKSVLVN